MEYGKTIGGLMGTAMILKVATNLIPKVPKTKKIRKKLKGGCKK